MRTFVMKHLTVAKQAALALGTTDGERIVAVVAGLAAEDAQLPAVGSELDVDLAPVEGSATAGVWTYAWLKDLTVLASPMSEKVREGAPLCEAAAQKLRKQ